MRLAIFFWAFVCSWTLFHSIEYFRFSNIDLAILFGTCFMVSLYLFIVKIVTYIKEDFPVKLDVKIQAKEKEKE